MFRAEREKSDEQGGCNPWRGVGLAAAAHVLEQGMEPLILEQEQDVAHAVRWWGHVPMFSNWRDNTATGHEQIRSIAVETAGNHAAAARVELMLLGTGVFSGPGPRLADRADSTCCGGSEQNRAAALCAKDEAAKETGASGCGCGDKAECPKASTCC